MAESFGRNEGGEARVHLVAGKGLKDVTCFTVDDEPWSRVHPGQTIKVKGKWPEFNIGPTPVGKTNYKGVSGANWCADSGLGGGLGGQCACDAQWKRAATGGIN